MVISKEWSVLIIGDGDLSFSRSIFENYKPKKLTATILDSELELTQKYGADNFTFLQQAPSLATSEQNHCECEVITEFDITNLQTVKQLTKCYDLVIFQFPLVPNFANQQQFKQQTQDDGLALSINTLNRRLLRMFLIHSFEYLLSENGAQLAYISSKDVKPYIEWDVEYSLTKGAKLESGVLNCIGSVSFDIQQFPGYKIRNVDRDKHVKDTASVTYIWTLANNITGASDLFSDLTLPTPLFDENGCDICHAGPFASTEEKHNHLAGKKHNRMKMYDSQWKAYLDLDNRNVSKD